MVTELDPKAVVSVAPEMSAEGVPELTVPVAVEPIVKSAGSINQLPVLPSVAAVVILASLATCT